MQDIYLNTSEFEHYLIKQQSSCSYVILESKHFFNEILYTCSFQYVLHLLHIILKFTLQSWQVPRRSVGRALYRESGPSQDGDPDSGNLPFFFPFIRFLL